MDAREINDSIPPDGVAHSGGIRVIYVYIYIFTVMNFALNDDRF
jgi:hypothetical protein